MKQQYEKFMCTSCGWTGKRWNTIQSCPDCSAKKELLIKFKGKKDIPTHINLKNYERHEVL